MVRDRNESGQYADGIDPETVLDVVDAREDLARPITAGDVVDELGIARRTAHNKLGALVERDVLETRKIGARGRVWWRPILADSGDTHPPRDGRESVETRPRDERDQSAAPAADEPSTTDAAGEAGDVIDAAVDKAAESWEDAEARLAARKNAARAVLEGLRERPMSRGEMVERYYDDYDISGQSEDTWYRKNLAECENAPLKAVASYNSGTRKWEFDASGGDR